jgi:glycosyltransferase involved in cell wall biosynthesis
MGAIAALGAGTPVIALDRSLVTDALVHGESGYVAVDGGHAAQWTASLSNLRPALARARARMLFDPEMVALRYAQLYRQIEAGQHAEFVHPERGSRGEGLAFASR